MNPVGDKDKYKQAEDMQFDNQEGIANKDISSKLIKTNPLT